MLADDIHPSLWRASQLARSRGESLRRATRRCPASSPAVAGPRAHLSNCWSSSPASVNCACSARRSRQETAGRSHFCSRRTFPVRGWKQSSSMPAGYSGCKQNRRRTRYGLQSRFCGQALVQYWAQHDPVLSPEAIASRRTGLGVPVLDDPAAGNSQDSFPAILRVALRLSEEGVVVDIVKRRGTIGSEPVSISLRPTPVLFSPRGRQLRKRILSPIEGVALTESVES